MKYGLIINGDMLCDPITDQGHLIDIAARHGFAVSEPITGPVTQTVAGRTLQILPGIEERPAPPEPVGYHGTLTGWQPDTDHQRFVRTMDYQRLSFDAMVEDVKRHIAQQQDAGLARIEHGYTAQEVKTWAQQQTEATAWTADNTAPIPLIEGLAMRWGVTVASVVEKINAKVIAAATMTGIVLGDAQAAVTRIEQLQAKAAADQLDDTWFDQLTGIANHWRLNWPPELMV